MEAVRKDIVQRISGDLDMVARSSCYSVDNIAPAISRSRLKRCLNVQMFKCSNVQVVILSIPFPPPAPATLQLQPRPSFHSSRHASLRQTLAISTRLTVHTQSARDYSRVALTRCLVTLGWIICCTPSFRPASSSPSISPLGSCTTSNVSLLGLLFFFFFSR
jgi:hypothetical protein